MAKEIHKVDANVAETQLMVGFFFNTYPCGSWAGLSPQLLPLYPTFSSTFLTLSVYATDVQSVRQSEKLKAREENAPSSTPSMSTSPQPEQRT